MSRPAPQRQKWRPKAPDGIVLGRTNQYATLETIMADIALSPGTKNAAYALAVRLNGDSGWTFASLDNLAGLIGMRRGDMARHLAALEGGERPTDKNSPKRSARYVHSVRFGSGRGQTMFRCFIEPSWVSAPVRE
jgi:hypothetical protein